LTIRIAPTSVTSDRSRATHGIVQIDEGLVLKPFPISQTLSVTYNRRYSQNECYYGLPSILTFELKYVFWRKCGPP
jgi:hypothetical protein